ncbi:hypothetical protein [Microbacterium sp. LWO12-1.2]|uniref:hypothetical protein n=1 Tax=Microbacterium sp. LWO12-1.2 TaxID=3135261 RepID=UPI00342B686F
MTAVPRDPRSPRLCVALDAVRLANRGELGREELVTILSTWTYIPRYRQIASANQIFLEPDSLDAVDVAYFDCGLLTDDQYSRILRGARVRREPTEGGD